MHENRTENQTANSALICVGLSHRSSSMQQRECLANVVDHWAERCLQACPDGAEWALLSTCNRIELYLAIEGAPADVVTELRRCTAAVTGLGEHELADTFYISTGDETAEHLLSVAAGLDSMILGESQILGQVVKAYLRAVERGSIGPALRGLFRAAIRTGKRVRSETALGHSPASVSSVALDLAAARLGQLRDRRLTVIGLGEIGGILLKIAKARGMRQVSVVNRTFARAQAVAEPGWKVYPLEDLPAALEDADIIITATGAPHPVIRGEMLAQALQSREQPAGSAHAEPLLVIDLALPRDVELGGAPLPGVTLIDLDDIQRHIAAARAQRASAAGDARQIVAQELARFRSHLRELSVRPLVVELRQRAESIREQELQRTLRFLGDVDPETRAHLHHLTRALVNKLLHQPTVRMKRMARERSAAESAAAARELFGLENNASQY
ncbi:MAG: glutamyl-tRNA reductase [Chloroflexota bacterium]|nr:glutamyl-tRNA reductase [Chloroflexota bacterium]